MFAGGSVAVTMLTPSSAYAPQEALTAPARQRAELWRLVPAAIVILAFYMAPLILLGTYLAETYGRLIASAIYARMARGDTPGAMLLLLWSFTGLLLGPMAAARLVNRRGAGSLIGPSLSSAASDFARVVVPLLMLQIVLLPVMLSGAEIAPGLGFGAFLFYLPFALPGILIQTGAEELLFRGYLQSQLAARFRSPVIWIGIPSALFAFGHYLPDAYGPSTWMVVLWAALFGILAADLTARTGSLGAALGFHFANNASAMLLVGIPGNLDGLALWSLPVDLSDPEVAQPALVLDFAMMIVSWLLVRVRLRV